MADPALESRYRASGLASRLDIAEWLANDLLTRLEASFTIGTNVLTIKYKSDSAIQAARIANAFLCAFMDAAVEIKIASARQTAEWFEPQTEKLRADLVAAREKLAKFQRESQTLAPNAGNDSQSTPMLAVTTQLSNAQAQLLDVERQLAASAGNAEAGTTETQATDSAFMTTLKGRLAQVNQEIGTLRTTVGSNNAKLMALLEARKSLQEQLRAEISTNRQELTKRAKSLKDQIAFLEKVSAAEVEKMIAIQGNRDELNSLHREVEVRQQQLENVAKSAEAARMQSQLSLSNLSILDTAIPPVAPAFPNRSLVIVAGLGSSSQSSVRDVMSK
jgi:polysaccharide biosynthesis transport protein